MVRRQSWMKAVVLAFVVVFTPLYLWAQTFVPATFDDVDRAKFTNGYWNGSDGSGEIRSGTILFKNTYISAWDFWSGFALSTKKDTQTRGWLNQYSAITGEGIDGSSTYAVGYYSSFAGETELILDSPQRLSGLYVTNTTYAYWSMKEGDQFAKKFAEGDWFKLTITGRNANGDSTGKKDVYLADFRNGAASPPILDSWKWVDLSSLGEVKRLTFSMKSSDNSADGMNTPAYFALDNVGGPRIMEAEDSDSSCFIQTLGW
ncbi:DUF4465 domain-containing protein [Desulfobotulus sp. H1]|uniref:DUF4465 domain-containing protein n=1 Tax=Desulfobotulus pelophilus TaxID=2823377 RepID=A0ABT3NAZ5_9BACT|nr:DUF4465 domain-containing protein [Desulfobotulus pelophilus]MCW7754142.1 DUF4465 domain-containing protein [Desulfobotulus pelophilus]